MKDTIDVYFHYESRLTGVKFLIMLKTNSTQWAVHHVNCRYQKATHESDELKINKPLDFDNKKFRSSPFKQK